MEFSNIISRWRRHGVAACLLAAGLGALATPGVAIAQLAPEFANLPQPARGEAIPAGDKLGAVVKFGTGTRPMILIPDSANSGAIYLEPFARFEDDATMYAVTLRGNGGTARPEGPVENWEGNAWTKLAGEGIAELIDREDLTGVVIVGHGNGVQAAWLAANAQPDRVVGIIGLDGYVTHPVQPGTTRLQMVQGMEARMVRSNDDMSERLRRTIIGASIQDLEATEKVLQDHMLTPRDVRRRYMLEAQNIDLRDMAERLGVPALLIAAIPDTTSERRNEVIRERFNEVYGQMPGAFIEYFDGTRKYIMYDAPDLLETAVMDFITTLPEPEPAEQGGTASGEEGDATGDGGDDEASSENKPGER